jgi:flagellar basal body-associated protein FliL
MDRESDDSATLWVILAVGLLLLVGGGLAAFWFLGRAAREEAVFHEVGPGPVMEERFEGGRQEAPPKDRTEW